jgi:hypothetical protein
MKWFSFFKTKRIAFLDGDQPLPGVLAAHAKYLRGIETHLIRQQTYDANEPKVLRELDQGLGIDKIYLRGYKTGKEVTDKFIGAYIQKSITEGYREITVVSSDYDFIDVFKMAVQMDSSAAKITFRLIVPNPQGKLAKLTGKVMNIEVINEKLQK